jgi:hypothetical protein
VFVVWLPPCTRENKTRHVFAENSIVETAGNIYDRPESAFIPFVSFGDLDNNTFKGLTSLLSVEQGIQYDEHT